MTANNGRCRPECGESLPDPHGRNVDPVDGHDARDLDPTAGRDATREDTDDPA
ncbi:hypothetical protein [Saccharomonospora iraqiensis]|uniref:hypothetical protein n=1 Tax=Saccharomonospora iraqiensis TaxID=52698 RepID=UPI000307270E|nr:hypothetical protein [Saccharomonospora iraqiensis]